MAFYGCYSNFKVLNGHSRVLNRAFMVFNRVFDVLNRAFRVFNTCFDVVNMVFIYFCRVWGGVFRFRV